MHGACICMRVYVCMCKCVCMYVRVFIYVCMCVRVFSAGYGAPPVGGGASFYQQESYSGQIGAAVYFVHISHTVRTSYLCVYAICLCAWHIFVCVYGILVCVWHVRMRMSHICVSCVCNIFVRMAYICAYVKHCVCVVYFCVCHIFLLVS